jgi:hypothetical protein
MDYIYERLNKEFGDKYTTEQIWGYTDENLSNGLTHKENYDNLIEFLESEDEYAGGGEAGERYNIVKVFRKSGRREILEKNLTLEEARRVVSRYPNSNTSMVVFMKMYANGGEVSEEEIDDFVFEYGVSRKEAEETLKRRKGRLSHKENLRLKELSTKNRNVGLTLTDSEEIEFDKLVHKYRGWDYIMADGGEAGKKGKLNATYIPKRNIKTLTTTYGNTIKGKDLLDGAYTTRKDIRQDPKMVRTIFEEEEFAEFNNGGEAKKRRRRANTQTGRTDRSVDKTRVGKPVGYRFSNSLASKLRKDKYAVPTEKQITKYLGKGIYKENRKNRSDRDKTVKL